ncbi:MAG: flavodoxin-dependent (E)-4-hydroxy-3-methylbut-2-enyl-diphosphate synthase [Candidatus Aminicenantaceae bacterium]
MNKEKRTLEFPRRETRQVVVGGVRIGGGAPIIVQSMTDTDTRDIDATAAQIRKLEGHGCEIVRVAVPDREAAAALSAIKQQSRIPLIADIHFDYRLALESLAADVDGLRINPGNIGSRERVRQVVSAAAERNIPIRIGVNSGSLEKDLLKQHNGATAEAMVESALRHIRILEDLDFRAIKVSLKASDIPRTLRAYRLLAEEVDYPFHAGITEAGSLLSGSVKSAAGLTLLLAEGLVDTLRVSLTAPPENEVRVAYRILSSLGIRQRGPDIISCPVCGRCEVDISRIADEVEQKLALLTAPIRVAVMGCMVNGPGEAKEADIGVACGRGSAVIFKQGRILRKLKEEEIVDVLVSEAFLLAGE